MTFLPKRYQPGPWHVLGSPAEHALTSDGMVSVVDSTRGNLVARVVPGGTPEAVAAAPDLIAAAAFALVAFDPEHPDYDRLAEDEAERAGAQERHPDMANVRAAALTMMRAALAKAGVL